MVNCRGVTQVLTSMKMNWMKATSLPATSAELAAGNGNRPARD